MKAEIVTFDADPDHGGFGARVHSIVSMFAAFAEVRVVRTDWFRGPKVPGVRYEDRPLTETLRSRLGRLRTYYRTDFPRRESVDVPDFTVVESLDLVGLHQYGTGVPLILDEHNVYWDLLRVEMPNSPFFKTWLGRRALLRRWLLPRLLARAKAFEREWLRRAARTLVPSEADRGRILEEVPELEGRVHVLPNCIDPARFPPTEAPPESTTVLFVGNFNFIPNREAARYLTRDVAPFLPEAAFLLVGGNPPPVGPGPGTVRATGYVEDLRPHLADAAVCVAPLTHGSGTRLKILTYLAAGKAVVATSKACEGLRVEDGVHLLVRDRPEAFRSALRELLSDPDRRRALGSEGRRLVEAAYDWRNYVDWARAFAEDVVTEGGA